MVINTPTGAGARRDGYEIRNAAVRHGIPCITTMTGASAAARAIVAGARGGAEPRSLQELHGDAERRAREPPRRRERRRRADERVLAPVRRAGVCEVVAQRGDRRLP